MTRYYSIMIVLAGLMVSAAQAQTTRPSGGAATRPSTGAADTDKMLKQLLSPSPRQQKPLEPIDFAPTVDQTSAKAVAPKSQLQNLVREGTYLVNRVGRLTRTAEGQFELTFEADGSTMQDAPMVILPNLKLMQMESAVRANSRDLKFRVTGLITEYNSRNHILLEKVVVVQDGVPISPAQQKSDERQQSN